MPNLVTLNSFGEVAAEDDAVLDYFVQTNTYQQIIDGSRMLVLGRKGSGKTALVRFLTEHPASRLLSRALRFRDYPWTVHAQRVDHGASPIEAYTVSWEYLIAVHLASMVFDAIGDCNDPDITKIGRFLRNNYGQAKAELKDTLVPDALRVEGSFEPMAFGFKLLKIDLRRKPSERSLGSELSVLTDAILRAVMNAAGRFLADSTVLLHLDELDQGLATLDATRSTMLVGLVLATRSIKRKFAEHKIRLTPVVYLRTDIWEQLQFSDKNKISESQATRIEWETQSLRRLIEMRASTKLGESVVWDALEDGEKMRGSQPKWNHIVARTQLRPRDAIQFCNIAFGKRADRSLPLTNADVVSARQEYSTYLKHELDDEILAHWPMWSSALETFTALQIHTFSPEQFRAEFQTRDDRTPPDEALERLFSFSVIGYQARSGYGGSTWVFRYEIPSAHWDPFTSLCKVHPGLKEYCRIQEDRHN